MEKFTLIGHLKNGGGIYFRKDNEIAIERDYEFLCFPSEKELKEVYEIFPHLKPALPTEILADKELTVHQKYQLLIQNQCPDCLQTAFNEGPHGGLSVNIQCIVCGSKFNVFPPHFAERI